MKAIQIHTFGGPEVLHYEEIARPVPQAGEVLVQVRAAGVNPVDWGSRSYPLPTTTGAPQARFPYILGWDLAGTVVASGAEVTRFAPGAAVYGMPRFPGAARAYSEYTAVPAADLARKPEGLTWEQAAALPMAALAAWQALFEVAALQEGETVFIPGAAGGVGHLAVQLAKSRGARVIAATSTRNLAFVQDLGADIVLDYTHQTLETSLEQIDVVLDTMGEDLLRQACRSLRPGGRIASLIRAHGELGTQLAAEAGACYRFLLVHPASDVLTSLARLCENGQLRVVVEAAFPLRQAAVAHRLSQQGHVRGKLVLTPADQT
ncbi:MAG TPA: NADP-dependent oxidoreductase [Ktedonobacteraceae bacterium]|jgi:NADPH:quinone reductase-like Zn-dependent oxidoreductase